MDRRPRQTLEHRDKRGLQQGREARDEFVGQDWRSRQDQGGDGRTRIRQELLLGVGGYRALRAMGITPGVLHLNEGHSAFAVFEAIRTSMQEEGMDFDSAASQVTREVIFTTHTPVPAGHDRFHEALIEEHLGPLREEMGMSVEDFMALGRPTSPPHRFGSTIKSSNGHGRMPTLRPTKAPAATMAGAAMNSNGTHARSAVSLSQGRSGAGT